MFAYQVMAPLGDVTEMRRTDSVLFSGALQACSLVGYVPVNLRAIT